MRAARYLDGMGLHHLLVVLEYSGCDLVCPLYDLLHFVVEFSDRLFRSNGRFPNCRGGADPRAGGQQAQEACYLRCCTTNLAVLFCDSLVTLGVIFHLNDLI